MGRNASKSAIAAFIAALCAAGLVQAQAPQDLLKQYSCYTCHSNSETKTGPAFVDVAAKYRGKSDAPDHVATTMRKGRHGYGPWHMPPHPEISRADAMTMAKYILSLER
jgi:cytochrome c